MIPLTSIPLGLITLIIQTPSVDYIEFTPPYDQDILIRLYLYDKKPDVILNNILYHLRQNLDKHHKIDNDTDFISEFLTSHYAEHAKDVINTIHKNNHAKRSKNPPYWDYLAALYRFSDTEER